MKKQIAITCAAALASIGISHGQLVMTGLIDGPLLGGTPKAVELFAMEDIADLSLFTLELVSNAGSRVGIGNGFTLAGSASAGDYIYVSSEAVNFEATFGFAPTFVNGEANHNGDDDFYLYNGEAVIDAWGGSDLLDNTGTAYDILDSWAYRLDGFTTNPTFDTAEWTIAAVDSLDGLTASEIAAAVPFGTYAVPEPSVVALAGISLFAMLYMMRRRRSVIS